MTCKDLLGKPIVEKISIDLIKRIERLHQNSIYPQLTIIQVGKDNATTAYSKSIEKKCKDFKLFCDIIKFDTSVTENDLIDYIYNVNQDRNINGCIILKPLPKHIDERKINNALLPSKDLDCVNDCSLGKLFHYPDVIFAPCTAESCMEILKYYNVKLEGQNVVILGRSLVVGKPLYIMLTNKNATVTLCHSKTDNLKNIIEKADILISAIGIPKFITKKNIGINQVVIDVGINIDENGNLCGDVDYNDVKRIVNKITPVPNGVGSITTIKLIEHLISATEQQTNYYDL